MYTDLAQFEGLNGANHQPSNTLNFARQPTKRELDDILTNNCKLRENFNRQHHAFGLNGFINRFPRGWGEEGGNPINYVPPGVWIQLGARYF